MNISGVLVHTRPDLSVSISQDLNSIDGVEVHANDNGRLVVTVENDMTHSMADRVTEIQLMNGVLSAAVIYHHNEAMEDEEELIDIPIATCTH